jgi:plasmid stabilization system protein ParE
VKIYRRPQFLLDLAEELNWLQTNAGAEVAQEWYRSLKETIQQLHRHPLMGRERKDLRSRGIRSWRVSNFPRWLIFYEVDSGGNLIFYRIRHGHMDLTALKMNS